MLQRTPLSKNIQNSDKKGTKEKVIYRPSTDKLVLKLIPKLLASGTNGHVTLTSLQRGLQLSGRSLTLDGVRRCIDRLNNKLKKERKPPLPVQRRFARRSPAVPEQQILLAVLKAKEALRQRALPYQREPLLQEIHHKLQTVQPGCALSLQGLRKRIREINKRRPEEEQIKFCAYADLVTTELYRAEFKRYELEHKTRPLMREMLELLTKAVGYPVKAKLEREVRAQANQEGKERLWLNSDSRGYRDEQILKVYRQVKRRRKRPPIQKELLSRLPKKEGQLKPDLSWITSRLVRLRAIGHSLPVVGNKVVDKKVVLSAFRALRKKGTNPTAPEVNQYIRQKKPKLQQVTDSRVSAILRKHRNSLSKSSRDNYRTGRAIPSLNRSQFIWAYKKAAGSAPPFAFPDQRQVQKLLNRSTSPLLRVKRLLNQERAKEGRSPLLFHGETAARRLQLLSAFEHALAYGEPGSSVYCCAAQLLGRDQQNVRDQLKNCFRQFSQMGLSISNLPDPNFTIAETSDSNPLHWTKYYKAAVICCATLGVKHEKRVMALVNREVRYFVSAASLDRTLARKELFYFIPPLAVDLLAEKTGRLLPYSCANLLSQLRSKSVNTDQAQAVLEEAVKEILRGCAKKRLVKFIFDPIGRQTTKSNQRHG